MNKYNYHVPVLLNEVIHYLVTDRSGIYVECTLGGAGHSYSILKQLNDDGRLIGIDRDKEAIEYAKQKLKLFEKQIILKYGTFSNLRSILDDEGIEGVDGILLDLGLSSRHIDSVERGFSYLSDAPLDMRMNTEQELTAEAVINDFPVDTLKKIFREYGEERFAGKIAARIDRARKKERIMRTKQLTDIISGVVPYKMRIKTFSRIFQAIRIHVNDELNQLERVLSQTIPSLKLKGRLVTIAYHSLEDRMIKAFMQEKANPCICPPELPVCVCGRNPEVRILTKKIVLPTEKELSENPRSRSAKLRSFERIL